MTKEIHITVRIGIEGIPEAYVELPKILSLAELNFISSEVNSFTKDIVLAMVKAKQKEQNITFAWNPELIDHNLPFE